jgi:hypothetical protein
MAGTAAAPKCVPFSISLAVLAPDNKRQISFGLTKGCNADDTAFWIINFVLRDRIGDEFQDRVKLHVAVNTDKNPAAEKLAKEGLSNTDISFLVGPVTNRARKLPAGSNADAKLNTMLATVVDSHAPKS